MKKTAIVSCYFQHNYGSMLQAYATQMALDKLGYENETIDISGFNGEIKKAKLLYFAKASLTSDILLSKLGMARNLLKKSINDLIDLGYDWDVILDTRGWWAPDNYAPYLPNPLSIIDILYMRKGKIPFWYDKSKIKTKELSKQYEQKEYRIEGQKSN
mgnify:CR=1 FL=1